jgi:short-subunit dehydrogenase
MKSKEEFQKKYGPWALIAGASTGIGEAYSRQLAEKGLNLLLIARGKERLENLANELQSQYSIEARPIPIDLSTHNLLDQLKPQVDDLEIGLLIYNTAYSETRNFTEGKIEGILKTLDVNCRGVLLLCHEFGSKMVKRKRGGVILMSSMSGLQGSGLVSDYAATKAFDIILGEGLWAEWRHYGVDVLSVVAGATKTPTLAKLSEGKTKQPHAMQPEDVAKEALGYLGKGPRRMMGPLNKIGAFFIEHFLSRKLQVEIVTKETIKLFG